MISNEIIESIVKMPEKSAIVKKLKGGYAVEIYGKSHITPRFILKFSSMHRVDMFLLRLNITKVTIL